MAEVKVSLHFLVVLYVFMVAPFCYTDDSRFSSSHDDVEVRKLLKTLNKSPVKSIKSPDGDIIDCVHISQQPAFDHPLLKNHTIKTRPSYPPNIDGIAASSMINASTHERVSSSITQLWHSHGKCPKGTIPIRRTTKEDILRGNSVNSYGKKKKNKSFPVGRQSSIFDAKLNEYDSDEPPNGNHEYAIASTEGHFYGAKASLNVWNPYVENNDEEFSSSQIWIRGGDYDTGLNTIEAGWQVNPGLYGDTNTRFFIYWTSDAYVNTGCSCNRCPGFVQTSNKYALGGSISPLSQTDATQYEITIVIWKDQKRGDWWLQLNGEIIGYWPYKLFTHLKGCANVIQWGGEIVNTGSQGRHTRTQMGSGQLSKRWYRKASYIRKIETVDDSNTLRTAQVFTYNDEAFYDISTRVTTDNFWGTHFFYGGSG